MKFKINNQWRKVDGCLCFTVLNFYFYGTNDSFIKGYGVVILNFGFEWYRLNKVSAGPA